MTKIKVLGREIALPHTISIIGLAKNVGKTTTLNHIIRNLPEEARPGVSSTGLDGERYDSITGKPKPRIFLKRGTFAATTDDCLSKSEARYETIERTGMKTSMGEVMIIRAEEDGFFEIAGPCSISELSEVKKKFLALGCGAVIFDGSINRKASSSVRICDSLILASGLNAGAGIFQAKSNLMFWKTIYDLPKFSEFKAPESERKFAVMEDGAVSGSSESINDLPPGPCRALSVKGALTDQTALEILDAAIEPEAILAHEPSSIFVTPRTLARLNRKGRLFVREKAELRAITLNPTSPSHVHESVRFFNEMKDACEPHDTFDVVAGLSAVY